MTQGEACGLVEDDCTLWNLELERGVLAESSSSFKMERQTENLRLLSIVLVLSKKSKSKN
ncbi:MAG: hypothetical protein GYA55_05865 [SAR324 cluster bacterium]|uniref:Uncharacterized protein n=1 Tax=SAR324 cluster bacterium TaxID=2024889 RepID=A0A7X9FRT3_9DELT|nr:hypothetical protein [SAR324 cluster bacterium]